LARAKKNGKYISDLSIEKRVDFSWILGIGTNFTEKISMDVRYFYGIRPVVDYEFQKKYNRGFQLSLSYTFLKK
jgi:opacity protein-like surface antigen